ncbi:biotin/lipoyl-containing protein [Actinoplanes sp. NPDC026619]|uniref:acetyl-CoA carboxylase biotin carboxyl carrier protein n=1 Tax=Actinoplanes sp. NPDC026619 TaxID=3155798 RepID=UPI0033D9C275
MEEALQAIRRLREEVASVAKTIPGTVSRVSLRVGDCALEITWEPPAGVERSPVAAPAGHVEPALPAEPVRAPADDALRTVAAPLVGTFYTAPAPGAESFVAPGARIEPGQPIGIVEAMKLMNEVASDWSGEVVEVLVGDGEPVEFGQDLVLIRVADR